MNTSFWIGFLVGVPVWAALGVFCLAAMRLGADADAEEQDEIRCRRIRAVTARLEQMAAATNHAYPVASHKLFHLLNVDA